jgi:hypothetical protein
MDEEIETPIAPMDAAELAACLAAIAWSEIKLPRVACVLPTVAAKWLSGKAAVPLQIAAWLRYLATIHREAPSPFSRDAPERRYDVRRKPVVAVPAVAKPHRVARAAAAPVDYANAIAAPVGLTPEAALVVPPAYEPAPGQSHFKIVPATGPYSGHPNPPA